MRFAYVMLASLVVLVGIDGASQRRLQERANKGMLAIALKLELAIQAALTPKAWAQEAVPLELLQTIPLPGVQGRFDHFACDIKGGRAFVAALGNNTLEVVDFTRSARLKSIASLRKPTGVLFDANSQLVQVANGDDGSVRAYRTDTFALSQRLEGLDDADNMRFDGALRRIYVGYGDGALGVVDSALSRVVASIALPGHPEAFQLETLGNRIFVNVPDAHEVAVIDRDQRRAIAHWPLEKFGGNFPMALEEDTHRLFVGCRNPPRLVVLDTTTGRITSDIAISGDADDLFYDAGRRRLYISCGEGYLDTVQCDEHESYRRVGRQPTRDGARTSFLVPELDRLLLAVPRRGTHEAEIRVYRPR